ncbi:PHP domain-containing protein [Cohnella abietis]|uniref:Phosphotransferase n=1 Tax=Cohnella abietis TaxID=2507935 RepID=A0A3T1D1N4_9BACL|nr:CehA/McbA family metallohydrolase [Cohnella abietis]BBI31929.1 phosphotransferase [Cohnella abietis]
MKNKIYLDGSKPTYKGNLHLHTTWSDGSLPAAEVVQAFKEKGYQFISISDHDIYSRTDEFNSADFITIPGMERGGLNPVLDKDPGYHIGVIDDPTVEPEEERFEHLQTFSTPIPWEGDHSPQVLIDKMRAHGNLVIFNHPEWHLTRFEDMVKYDGFFAIEIYNHATEWSTSSSYGAAYWDHALQNGKRVFGIAGDDSHEHNPNWKVPEYGGGWVKVQSAALTHVDIVQSLKQGQFYSSSGPEIYDLRVEDGQLSIECSPCKFIMFKAFPLRGPFVGNYESGEPVSQASMAIEEDMEYIRVECIDFQGNVAWSNPVFVADLIQGGE